MATKSELLKRAKGLDLVPADADAEDFTADDLERLLASVEPDTPAWEGSLSDNPTPPAPDGHDFQKNLLDA